MNRDQKVARILSAVNYNSHARDIASCNSLYMGSMSTCLLYGKLGGNWPGDLDAVLAKATDAQLDAGLEHCANILKHVDREAAELAARQRRCTANGKQVLLDGRHMADAFSEAAAQVIADCVEYFNSDMVAHDDPAAHDRVTSYLA